MRSLKLPDPSEGYVGGGGGFVPPASASKGTITAVSADAPAGGTGAAAGGYDTAGHRDTAITLLSNLRTRSTEVENTLRAFGLLT